jgi:ABC-type transport system substrate-binding protein
MTRFVSLSLALASACAAVTVVDAARPRYGGTLRVQTAGAIQRIDPSAVPSDASERWLRDRILPLMFEGLTRVDPERGLQALLAVSWQADPDFRRWRIRLASGVVFHDGSLLQPGQVAASLQAVEGRWKVAADGETLLVDLPQPLPDLPWVLADSAHAIALRNAAGQLVGTGPFRLERHDGLELSLRAHEEYRAGRPFLDGLRVQMGRSHSSQIADLEAGRADFVAVLPGDSRRLAQRGMRLFETRPLELIALVFEPHRATVAFDAVRRTISGAIDRSRIAGVLLQQHAEPTGALLPMWLSGYRTREQRGAGLSRSSVAALAADQRQLVLRFDGSDPLGQSVAERIAVDVREAGFVVTLQSPVGLAPRPDMRLMRVRLTATTPDRAFADLVATLGPGAIGDTIRTTPQPGSAIDIVYKMETQLLDRAVIVPIVHVPEMYAAGADVQTWESPAVLGSGAWAFDELWLRTARP